jgi:hypothetical protein
MDGKGRKGVNTITEKEMMRMLACLELFLSLNLLCDLGHFIQLLEFNKTRYNLYRVYNISVSASSEVF